MFSLYRFYAMLPSTHETNWLNNNFNCCYNSTGFKNHSQYLQVFDSGTVIAPGRKKKLWETYKGKLKSVAQHQVTYYSTFDDRAIRGKLKSIGPHNYTWYTSMDRQGYGGGLKSGNQYLLLEGVTFTIW